MSKKRVLVWLSGWVDSAVSAYLLQKEWYEVVAWFMKNYVSDEWNCPTREDRDEAIKVAEFLWIKEFIIFDFREDYNKKVVDYIYDGYKKWITPNPDILCNSEIKFRLFLDKALSLWFDAIATWHYARILEKEDWKLGLFKGLDDSKDQSYFLSGLNEEQLSKSIFPIWSMHKTEVRELAEKINLPNAKRKDSQWICFVWKVDMHKFLETKIPEKKWNIIDTSWKIIWEHNWAWYFTVWQRKWICVWWWPALFVVKKDVLNNEIIVWWAEDLELYSDRLFASDWHWISKSLKFPIKWQAKIRYRQKDQEVEIFDRWYGHVEAIFSEKQRAVASWQQIALYIGEELVWSWVID